MGEQRRAIVVGAGIGGLAAAIGLRRVGWDVVVYEQTAAPRPVGAGISLWSNARRALAWLGVDDAIGDRGVTGPGGGVRTPNGRWLSDRLGENLLTPEEVSMVMVHRADLQAALLAALPPEVVRFDSAVEQIEETAEQVAVRLTAPNTSRTATADALVAADGVWSGCRSQLWPSGFRPRYAGFTAWRGVTDESFPLATQSQTLVAISGSSSGAAPPRHAPRGVLLGPDTTRYPSLVGLAMHAPERRRPSMNSRR